MIDDDEIDWDAIKYKPENTLARIEMKAETIAGYAKGIYHALWAVGFLLVAILWKLG